MNYTVNITGASEADWDFHPNVSSDLGCTKTIEDPMAVIEHVTVKEGLRDLVTQGDWEKGYEPGDCTKPDYVASFRQGIKLKPRIPYQVTITYSIRDRLKGYCNHTFFQPVSRIKYILTLDPG